MVLNPSRLQKIFLSNNPLCWWHCNKIGNLYHTLWGGKIFQNFWNSVSSLLSSLMIPNRRTSLTPELALLGIGLDAYAMSQRTVVAHILNAVRLSLSKNWKSTGEPTISMVISRLNTQCQYEKMLAYRDRKVDRFHGSWKL